MHYSTGCYRSLSAASLAFGQVAFGQILVMGMATNGANETVRPSQLEQVISTGSLRPEASLELRQGHVLIGLVHNNLQLGRKGKYHVPHLIRQVFLPKRLFS